MMSRLLHYSLVPLILRLGLAVVFIFHGWGKVFGETAGMGTSWNNSPDMSPVVQFLVAWGELLGGVAMALGLLTRVAALGLAIIMAGAIALVHGQHGFSGPKGYEFNFVLIVMCVAVMLTGSGAFGIDHWFKFRSKSDR